jgi:hypothetical protein
MLKPGKTFNLDKQTKRFMATIVDPQARGAFKRAMIQAQLESEIVPKREPRKPGQGGGSGQNHGGAYTAPENLTS